MTTCWSLFSVSRKGLQREVLLATILLERWHKAHHSKSAFGKAVSPARISLIAGCLTLNNGSRNDGSPARRRDSTGYFSGNWRTRARRREESLRGSYHIHVQRWWVLFLFWATLTLRLKVSTTWFWHVLLLQTGTVDMCIISCEHKAQKRNLYQCD